jgi:hypothetical protein
VERIDMAKWDNYTNACDICGYRMEGYAEHETVCGACLDEIEQQETDKKEKACK